MRRIGEGLYVITDETLCPGRTHAEIALAAIAGGARIIQIRDKDACDRKFYEDALELRRITREAGALFIVNDRVDIAAAVEADGINIGQTDMPLAAARRVISILPSPHPEPVEGRRGAGGEVLIGISADTPEEARQVELDGADYIGYGPVFPTATKLDAGPVSGLAMLKAVCEASRLPVVAIGGISLDNIASVAQAGAACAAVISAIVCANDMSHATRQLIAEWEKGKA